MKPFMFRAENYIAALILIGWNIGLLVVGDIFVAAYKENTYVMLMYLVFCGVGGYLVGRVTYYLWIKIAKAKGRY